MKAIIDEVTRPGGLPVAISIVDDAGNMVAYSQMDNMRLYARRHAFRKAYTAAIMGMDTGAHGEQLKERAGRSVTTAILTLPPARAAWSSSPRTGSSWAASASADGWSAMRNWP